MSSTKTQRDFFSKVKIARQLLKEKSEEILKQYLLVVDEARASGDYETAAKSLQWLIEHMPSDEDGDRMVEVSVDKKQEAKQTGPVGPAIQIGIAVGGIGAGQKALPKPNDGPVITVIESE